MFSHQALFSPGIFAWVSTRIHPEEGIGRAGPCHGDRSQLTLVTTGGTWPLGLWPLHPHNAALGLHKSARTPQLGIWVWMSLTLLIDLLSPPTQPWKVHGDTVPKTTPPQKSHDLPPYQTTAELTLPRCSQYSGRCSSQITQSPRA